MGSGSGGDASPINPEYDGVISHWALDNEHGLDYFAGKNHATAYSNVAWSTGKTGGALSLSSGANRYIQIPALEGLSFSDGSSDLPFSVSFWIFPTSNAATKVLVSKRGTTPNAEYQITRNTSGNIAIQIFSEGNTTVFLGGTSAGSATINQWSFVTISYDASGLASGISITINGISQTVTDTSAGSYVGMLASSNLNIYIGASSFSQTSTTCYIGLIEDVTFFNKVLLSDQIASLYNNGNGIALTYTFSDITPYYIVSLVVLASRDNYQLATTIGSGARYLYWSDDGGITWKNRYDWGVQYSGDTPLAGFTITMAHIFSDGTLLFSTSNKIYRSTDKILTITDVTATNVFESDGVTPYTIHTPANATNPGIYFGNINNDPIDYEINGNEIFVWINYCNVELGAAPINVWYTIDNGVNIKSLYTFGQNPQIRDDGSVDGGSTGTLLGDSSNPLICRHGHSCVRNPGTFDWYSCCGDDSSNDEVHWLKHTYDPDNDTWVTTNVATDQSDSSKWKSIIGGIVSGEVYFGGDATNAPAQTECGIFKSSIANIGVSATRICNTGDTSSSSNVYVNSNGKVVATFGPNSDLSGNILIGDNFGSSFELYEISDLVGRGLHRMQPADSRGYVMIRSGGTTGRGWRTVFVKVS